MRLFKSNRAFIIETTNNKTHLFYSAIKDCHDLIIITLLPSDINLCKLIIAPVAYKIKAAIKRGTNLYGSIILNS